MEEAKNSYFSHPGRRFFFVCPYVLTRLAQRRDQLNKDYSFYRHERVANDEQNRAVTSVFYGSQGNGKQFVTCGRHGLERASIRGAAPRTRKTRAPLSARPHRQARCVAGGTRTRRQNLLALREKSHEIKRFKRCSAPKTKLTVEGETGG